METLLIGVGLIIVGYLIDIFLNPVSVFSTTFNGGIKIIGLIMVVIGLFNWFNEDKGDYDSTPHSFMTVDTYNSDESSYDAEESDDSEMAVDGPSYNDYETPSYGFSNDDESSYKAPVGHYVEIEEECDACGGKGYNIQRMWHGGDKVSEVKITCSKCHHKGRVKRREYVLD